MTENERKIKKKDLYLEYGQINCIKRELLSSACNACSVGFYLREIQMYDLWKCTDIYENNKYNPKYTFFDWCKDELNLSRRSVSRFIDINIAFSSKTSSGNSSIYLDEKYKKYNASQLAEMLGLSPAALNKIKPDMTVKDIRDIKAADRHEDDEDGIFMNKEEVVASSIEPTAVNVSCDKDFDLKKYKNKTYHVCNTVFDKFVSSPSQYTQQFFQLQEYLNKGYLVRIVLYEADNDIDKVG